MTKHRLIRGALASALAMGGGASLAQAPGPGSSFTLTPLYQTDSDFDHGGEAGFTGLLASVGHSWVLSLQSTLNLSWRLDYEDWHFDRLTAFGGSVPWSQLLRTGLSASYGTSAGDWRVNISPTVEYSGETGAELSDALVYGATLWAATRVSPDLSLGFGAGVFQHIEEIRVFPFIMLDWRITERLRLANPFIAGPAGPAGLELSYSGASGWDAGVGAASRTVRYRLDRNGPFGNGVGERKFVPVFVRVGHKLTPTLSLDFYLAATVGATLRIEDAGGNRLYDEKLGTAPLLGLSLAGRF